MKLGLLTAALPGMELTELATWASESGYQMLEIACWPSGKAERRYAGVSHIDVETLDKNGAKQIRAMLAERKLDVSSLAFYPNVMSADADANAANIAHLKRVIDAAMLLEVPIVG